MDRGRTTPPRVVLFVSPGLADGPVAGGRGGQFVRVSTAYEAAAELLAGPADALVVDLRLLKSAHMPLLDIARRRAVELLGTGALPWGASSDQLAGMKLVARGQLAEAVLAVAARPTGPPEAAETPQQPAPPAQGAQPSQGEKVGQTAQAGTYETQVPAASGAAGEEPLLTDEELSALLGDVE